MAQLGQEVTNAQITAPTDSTVNNATKYPVFLRVQSLVNKLKTPADREKFSNVFTAIYQCNFFGSSYRDSKEQIITELQKKGFFKTIMYGRGAFSTDEHKHYVEVHVNPTTPLVEDEEWVAIECEPATMSEIAEKLANKEPLAIPEKVIEEGELEINKKPELDVNTKHNIYLEIKVHAKNNTEEEKKESLTQFKRAYDDGKLRRYGDDNDKAILDAMKTNHFYSVTVYDGETKYSITLSVNKPDYIVEDLQTNLSEDANVDLQTYVNFLAKIKKTPTNKKPVNVQPKQPTIQSQHTVQQQPTVQQQQNTPAPGVQPAPTKPITAAPAVDSTPTTGPDKLEKKIEKPALQPQQKAQQPVPQTQKKDEKKEKFIEQADSNTQVPPQTQSTTSPSAPPTPTKKPVEQTKKNTPIAPLRVITEGDKINKEFNRLFEGLKELTDVRPNLTAKEHIVLRKLQNEIKKLQNKHPLSNSKNEAQLKENHAALVKGTLSAIKKADAKGNDNTQTLRTVLKSFLVGLMIALIIPGVIYFSVGAYKNAQAKKANKPAPFLYFQSPKRPNNVQVCTEDFKNKVNAIMVN